MTDTKHLSLKTALLTILFSTFIVSGSALGVLFYINHKDQLRNKEPKYNIVAVVQTTPEQERLKNFYLEELLQLSIDQPTNLFAFNINEAKRKLLSTAVIKSVDIKKQSPDTVFIDYTLRKPIAYLKDYTNTLIDEEGIVFPFKPFFTPKKLPEIYLGLNSEQLKLGQPLLEPKVKVALYLLQFLNETCCNKNSSQLVRVDVSNAYADSKGLRQIVVILEDRLAQKNEKGLIQSVAIQQILRISINNYRQELANYLALRTKIFESLQKNVNEKLEVSPLIIDLRIPELALIHGIAIS